MPSSVFSLPSCRSTRFPPEADLRLNRLPVLIVTLAVTAIAGVLSGYAPAWFASRVNPNESLKEGGSTGTSSEGHSRDLRRILASSGDDLRLRPLSLLTGAAKARFIHSFVNILNVDLGIKTDPRPHLQSLRSLTPAPKTQSASMPTISKYLLLCRQFRVCPVFQP